MKLRNGFVAIAAIAVATLAFGQEPGATSAAGVHETLGEHLDLIIDGGETPGGTGSTIVDTTFHPPRLIREGKIPFQEVLGCLGLSLTEDHEW